MSPRPARAGDASPILLHCHMLIANCRVPLCHKEFTSPCRFAAPSAASATLRRAYFRARYSISTSHRCARISRHAEPSRSNSAALLERSVDSIYLGGGTPSVLAPDQLERIFQRCSRRISRSTPSAEITVECAPGTISDEIMDTLLRCGVNRVSLGVQSFVDKESSVGRPTAYSRRHAR